MTWADTLGNMKALDKWREAVGLEYELEKPRPPQDQGRRPAARQAGKPMRRRKLSGIDGEAR